MEKKRKDSARKGDDDGDLFYAAEIDEIKKKLNEEMMKLRTSPQRPVAGSTPAVRLNVQSLEMTRPGDFVSGPYGPVGFNMRSDIEIVLVCSLPTSPDVRALNEILAGRDLSDWEVVLVPKRGAATPPMYTMNIEPNYGDLNERLKEAMVAFNIFGSGLTQPLETESAPEAEPEPEPAYPEDVSMRPRPLQLEKSP